ncbi:MAG: type I-E CRISPR-associated protein Cas6/Cse3/CasE [Bordetella sp. SCN 67-23]|nr:type I-E CRISPR-associated protein Cas6/Cse3/CasE [Burkholderiales bacterium]ODS72715.1 MAG: type I-E CRISPR-associated protein Cas6/Cse3/CasE [Bordetella sp. SCN 67-23]OJW92869.1 MAG: type I-E CRISPR-associated protein Cas6/Cse3/CasE [Burkholderiales bacterium 67-32]
MHFSVITPTPGLEHEAVRQLLPGAYTEHQWLWRFFPSEAGTARDHIFRRTDQGQAMRFYVVSKRPPVAFSDAWSVRTRPYAPRLQNGDELEFELRANPVVTRRHEDGKSRRHDVVMDAKTRAKTEGSQPATGYSLVRSACTTWLSQQGEQHGFQVDEASLSVDGYIQHVAKEDQLRFSSVDFRGGLRVTDQDAFSAMLASGLGHAKAFGCGLMLVRRPL